MSSKKREREEKLSLSPLFSLLSPLRLPPAIAAASVKVGRGGRRGRKDEKEEEDLSAERSRDDATMDDGSSPRPWLCREREGEEEEEEEGMMVL